MPFQLKPIFDFASSLSYSGVVRDTEIININKSNSFSIREDDIVLVLAQSSD